MQIDKPWLVHRSLAFKHLSNRDLQSRLLCTNVAQLFVAELCAHSLCRSFGVKLLIDQGGDSPWDDKAAFKLFQASKDAGGFEVEAGLYCVE